jgi:hypothetical protein
MTDLLARCFRPGRAAILLAVPVVFVSAIPAAQTGAAATSEQFTAISFRMEPRDPQAKTYVIHLRADGTGTYSIVAADAPIESPLHVGPATLTRIEQGTARIQPDHCEAKEKNIAQTGRKTVTLERSGTNVACTFNYSDDAKLMDAVEAFEALAETMLSGERLAHDHRFDRLGLDAEMDRLTTEVAEGRALEPGNIAPVLQSIGEDDRVIDRVRRKAQRLLTQSAEASTPASPR